MTGAATFPRSRRAQRGLTIVEVLVALTLLAVLLIPAVTAIHTGLLGSQVHSDTGRNHYRLLSRLETVLAESFDELEAAAAGPTVASSYSDAAGPSDRILVYIAGYDADNADADNDPFTGPDPDILWLRVAVEGSAASLDSLTTR
ncbi:MAG: prepilin-type N-terminal cleavage/methylation domain-containing protein [Woeseiaceae bacterium]|nr:prepilin-type N-terminal cleavage/methylation domain-containing protein [Woeseiaceae bacterium]